MEIEQRKLLYSRTFNGLRRQYCQWPKPRLSDEELLRIAAIAPDWELLSIRNFGAGSLKYIRELAASIEMHPWMAAGLVEVA